MERDNRGTSGAFLESGRYRVEIGSDGKVVGDERFFGSRPTVYDPSSERGWYKFPLRVGDSWKNRYLISQRLTGKSAWAYTTTKVVAYRELRVGDEGQFMGVFELFRTVETGSLQDEITYFYSPILKATVYAEIKRYSGSDVVSKEVIELVADGKNVYLHQ